jgi:hypothetical protein
MQKLDRIEVPESIPGLIWVVENDKNDRKWAAQSLAHYRDPRTIPTLRKALAETKGDEEYRSLIQSMISSGGFTDTEQVKAIEAYATRLNAPSGRDELFRYRPENAGLLPLEVALGRELARQNEVSDGVLRALFKRVAVLQQKNPILANTILEVAQRWRSKLVDQDLLRRIGDGSASAELIYFGLIRRDELKERVLPELRSLSIGRGSALGVVAVITEDESLAQRILGSADESAAIVLLVCARLIQFPLPIDQVGALLKSRSKLLSLAAQKFLLADDSPTARRLLLSHHAEQAFITGWRENEWSAPEDPTINFDDVEEKLRQELLASGEAPQEIFALLDNAEHPAHVVRVYRDRAMYSWYKKEGGYSSRAITPSALEQLRASLAAIKLSDSGPIINYCHHDCTPAEFVMLTRSGGRRVFSYQGRYDWETIVEKFTVLVENRGRNDPASR